jgi:S1-C subfamily serine protease
MKCFFLKVFFVCYAYILAGQVNPFVLNGYKYAIVEILRYEDAPVDYWGISEKVMSAIQKKGIIVIKGDDDFKKINPPINEIFYVNITHSRICEGCGTKKVRLSFKNFKNEIIYEAEGSGLCLVGLQCEVNRATNNALTGLNNLNYIYFQNLTPKISYPEVEKTSETEESLKNYYQTNQLNQIEGIYKSYNSEKMPNYKIGIKRRGEKFIAIVLESDKNSIWQLGEIKAYIEPSSIRGFYSIKWYNGGKSPEDVFAILEDDVIFSIEFKNLQTGEKRIEKFIKMYPQTNNYIKTNKEHKSSGSGFFVSTDGLIATNAHVINEANKIKIIISDQNENLEYDAKVVLKDNNNDVALLKIEDKKFNGLSIIPYSLYGKADIGEKVFTIGYPLNEVMGTNFKVSDGIVSSITGISDDVRYYQISVPLQPGNSGGPLFNYSGDIIGITTSRLNSQAVGTSIENVNYAVKISYLLNLYDMLPNSSKLSTMPSNANKELKEQVKILKNYVCIIMVY